MADGSLSKWKEAFVGKPIKPVNVSLSEFAFQGSITYVGLAAICAACAYCFPAASFHKGVFNITSGYFLVYVIARCLQAPALFRVIATLSLALAMTGLWLIADLFEHKQKLVFDVVFNGVLAFVFAWGYLFFAWAKNRRKFSNQTGSQFTGQVD